MEHQVEISLKQKGYPPINITVKVKSEKTDELTLTGMELVTSGDLHRNCIQYAAGDRASMPVSLDLAMLILSAIDGTVTQDELMDKFIENGFSF